MNRDIIINADDFGLNDHASKAIAQAFREGRITDTTMIATGGYFDEALALAKEQGFLDRIGIHLNLTEGEPLTEDILRCKSFVENGSYHHRNNRWKPLSAFEKQAIYKELSAQIEKIRRTGITITHADSHHHIHTAPFVAPIVVKVCREYGITGIRLHRNIGSISFVKRIVKKEFNQYLRKKGFITTDYFGSLADIENTGIPDRCEIMVHPDYDESGLLIDRCEEEGGFPVGKALPDLREERKVFLKGYAAL